MLVFLGRVSVLSKPVGMTWCSIHWLEKAYISLRTVYVQENMTRMLLVADVNESIKKHQAHIITSLKDPDIR
jgi:hypothetical protein